MLNRRKADRAKQFLPFDALKGFREALAQKEKIIVPRIELDEETLRRLAFRLNQVKKGQIIKVVYYHLGEYLALEGMVSTVDVENKFLKIVKTRVSFSDLRELQGHDIREDDFYQ